MRRMAKDTKEVYEASQFQFIANELDVAVTFLGIAESAKDNHPKAARNMEHARRAYEAATKFLEDARLTPERSRVIEEKLGRLRAHLKTAKVGPPDATS
jgi:uncharacterized coiled-coil DUF342 family protein